MEYFEETDVKERMLSKRRGYGGSLPDVLDLS